MNPASFLHQADAIDWRTWDFPANRIAPAWEEVAAYRANVGIATEGDTWQAMTDERIQAAMPIIPAAGILFGDDGFASITAPVLMLAGTIDTYVHYEYEIVPAYQQMASGDHYLITLIDYGHHYTITGRPGDYYKHFSAAFFGYHLQRQEEYAEYLTEEYVAQFEDLAWGIYDPTGGPALLQLTFDGESCTYEGPTELTAGPVELLFHNESEGRAAVNLVRHTGDETIQDIIDYIGEEPTTKHHPSWTVELGTWRIIGPDETHRWEGELEPAIHHMVCARLSPIGAWFGTGLTVRD